MPEADLLPLSLFLPLIRLSGPGPGGSLVDVADPGTVRDDFLVFPEAGFRGMRVCAACPTGTITQPACLTMPRAI